VSLPAPTPGRSRAARPLFGARRPRSEGGEPRDVRAAETVVLLLAGLALAIATINDVVLRTHTNDRLVADLRTWRLYTGHDYHNLNVSQDVVTHTTRDVVCGNTSPGGPKERVQLCLAMTGPVVSGGRRRARGGWYLPPKAENLRRYRFACFGTAKEQRQCPR
jgi:hypothetical protein